ncbi:MAG: sialidase family protein [Planctomycetaceae bacterium]
MFPLFSSYFRRAEMFQLSRLVFPVCITMLVVAVRFSLAVDTTTEPVIRSEFVFPLNPQHNHAPGIAELPDGELIVSWYRGSGERTADDVAVYGSRLKVGQKEWGPEFLMTDTPGFPDCNTSMMTDAKGRLMLFWPVIIANSWESCLTHVKVSDNPIGEGPPNWNQDLTILLKPDDFSGEATRVLEQLLSAFHATLSEKQLLVIEEAKKKLSQKLYQRMGWQPRCKPTVLPSGRILLPLYTDTFSISIMAISDDGGSTWSASKPLLGFGAIQPAVLRRDNGTLVAYMRENGYTGHVRVCESTDDGVTWGPVGVSELVNPGSGLDGVRLKNGHWVLVHNDTTAGRNQLAVSLSTDEGLTWKVSRHLEQQPTGSFHYPCVIQTKDGMIHAVYSYFCDEGKTMKHAAFSEAWILSGESDSK